MFLYKLEGNTYLIKVFKFTFIGWFVVTEKNKMNFVSHYYHELTICAKFVCQKGKYVYNILCKLIVEVNWCTF